MRLPLIVIISLTTSVAALAGPNSNGRLVLHWDEEAVYSFGASYCDSLDLRHCGEIVVDALPLGSSQLVHAFLAFEDNDLHRVSAVAFGISYPSDVVVEDFGLCGDFDLTQGAWPDSGAGAAVTWAMAQTSDLVSTAWFGISASSPAVFELIAHPSQGAVVTDDSVPAIVDSLGCLGAIGFGTNGATCCAVVGIEEPVEAAETERTLVVRRLQVLDIDLPLDGHVLLLDVSGRRVSHSRDGRVVAPARPGVYWMCVYEGKEIRRTQRVIVS